VIVDDTPAAFVYHTNSHAAMSRRGVDRPAGIWGTLADWDRTGLQKA